MKRNTVAKKIQQEANPAKKLLLGLFGEEKHPLEVSVRRFLDMPNVMKQFAAGSELKGNYPKAVTEKLFEDFLVAVMQRDGEAIRAVASVLEKKDFSDADIADPLRAKIQLSRDMLAEGAPLLTYAELAEKIQYTGDIDPFRKIVDALGHPIKKQVGGRPRINPDK